MTAASALPFQAMEVPAAEDSMEMASPYQGQADDFDIDIDLMEDHASNMDSDMVGAEDFPPTSQPSLFNDVNNDADMADEPSEGSMVDADTLVDDDHDIDVQDENVTYEADMLEGDQDEEIVEAVPTIQVETAEVHEEIIPQPGQDVVEPVVEEAVGLTQEVPEPTEAPAVPSSETQVLQPDVEPQPETANIEQPQETAPLEQNIFEEPKPVAQDHVESPNEPQATASSAPNDQTSLDEEARPTTENDAVNEEAHHSQLEASTAEEPEISHPVEEQSTSNLTADEKPENIQRQDDQEHANELDSANEHESLHPVKVLYQDNEISLFPPLEGDSAETFFLHDEDVAYDNVGRLFGSLREVLLDNVADDEVLVIDIDSLGIQLTEDSTNNSKMTLHRILDIYVRLSHNDGINDPDALYLTLSSKICAHSELAGLDTAANEGKGMSQIHAWDVDYEDGGNEDITEHEENQPTDDLAAGKPQIENYHGGDEASQNQNSGVDESEAASTTAEGQDDGHISKPDENSTLPGNDHDENKSTHDTEELASYQEDLTEGHGGFEASTAESSATITTTQEPGQLENEPLETNEDSWPHPQEDSKFEAHESEHDSNHETSEVPEADEHENEQDYGEYEDEAFPEETEEPEATVDTDAIDLTTTHDEEPINQPNSGTEDQEEVVDQAEDHESLGESESTVENAPKEDFDFQEHELDPEDDLLGIAEDVLQTTQNDRDDLLESSKDHSTTSLGEEVDATEPQTGESEGHDLYADFETSETIELGETDHSPADSQPNETPSAKRSREQDEDEWDFADINPDLKRRRPS